MKFPFDKEWLGIRQGYDVEEHVFFEDFSATLLSVAAVPTKKKKPDEPEKKPPKVCQNEGLRVKCGHGERKYELILPPPAGREEEFPSDLLQVIAGAEKGDTILATTQIIGGPCEKHKNKVLAVQGTKPNRVTDSEIEFTVVCF
jgi:hypothetical protein